MLENTLRNRLYQVARRFRQRQYWWNVAVIALVIAIVAALMLPSVTSGQMDAKSTAIVLFAAAVVMSLIALVISARSYRNPARIAKAVETKYPTLQQRLITAVSVSDNPELRSGYLQQQVIREACDHSQQYAWTETVPRGQVLLSRLSGIGAVALMLGVLGIMVFETEPAQALLANNPHELLNDVTVSPGDTEVERGTNLLVTARFNGEFESLVPSEGELRVVLRDGSESRLPMKQNLLDPVLGGLVVSVGESFGYQVLTPNWASPMYSVEVFEYPSLVRSDASIRYPSYTKIDDKTIEDTRRVSAVEGTTLVWKFLLNKPVASATLLNQQGESVALNLNDDGATAESNEMVLKDSQRYTLELIDDQGRANKYPPELIVRTLPNQQPKLKTTAAGDVRVSPLEELTVTAESEDDFGIEKMGLTYTFAGNTQEVVLASDVGRTRKLSVEHLIEFESLKAEPDQLLTYYFWAEDVGPDGNPRRTQGDMYFAEVRPFEEIFREGDPPPGGQPSQPSENEQEAEKVAQSQKEIIGATWRVLRDGITSEFKSDVNLIAEAQQEQIEALDTLAENLQDEESLQYVSVARDAMETAVEELAAAESDDLEAHGRALAAEQLSYEGLLKLRAREFEVTRSQQQSQSSSSSSSAQQRQQQLNDLELEQDENRYETENQAQQNSAEEQQERETRQVLSRLRELAKRQEDINEQVAQLQSALEMAEDEKAKEEIERQLKRLRDQQQEMLREIDELDERMQSPENQSSMQEESEQLAQTRENVREASEALQQNDASKALSAGKRAERELESMRDEFRERAAGQFNDAVREMRDAASELDERQQDLSEQLQQQQNEPSPGLRAGTEQKELDQQIQSQRDRLRDLQEKMQETVEQAETAEPLLAESLYDSFRQTQQRQVDSRLEETSELLRNGFGEEAMQAETQANEGIRELREGLQKAADSVLGDESEALRRAASELEQLSRDLEEEIREANAGESGQSNPSEPRERSGEGGQQADRQQESRQQEGGPQRGEQSGEGQQQDGPPGDPQSGETPSGQRSPGELQDGQSQRGGDQRGDGQPGEGEPTGSRSGENENEQAEPTAQSGQNPGEGQGQSTRQSSEEPNGQMQRGTESRNSSASRSRNAANGPSSSPISGDGFREWTDQLRDVEEMVDDPEIRSRAARIRDRARDVRADLIRHAKAPQWDMVEEMIAKPLRELQRDVQEEWLRRSAEKNALVPIDRDPVPSEYSDAVRRYYERLGSGQ